MFESPNLIPARAAYLIHKPVSAVERDERGVRIHVGFSDGQVEDKTGKASLLEAETPAHVWFSETMQSALGQHPHPGDTGHRTLGEATVGSQVQVRRKCPLKARLPSFCVITEQRKRKQDNTNQSLLPRHPSHVVFQGIVEYLCLSQTKEMFLVQRSSNRQEMCLTPVFTNFHQLIGTKQHFQRTKIAISMQAKF